METSRLSVKDLLTTGEAGKEAVVKGWVRTKRGSKNVNFIALNDGSTLNNLQIVVDVSNFDESLLKKITTGAALCVTGEIVQSAGGQQSVELSAKKIEVLGESDSEKYPLQPKRHSLEFMR